MTAGKWIIAHRGDHSQARENTMAAFGGAIRAGADMIECDVRRLADGQLVIWHDDTMGGRPVEQLSPESLAEATAGIDVPTLSEVLQLCAGRILLDIELKDRGCEEEVLRTLASSGFNADGCVLTSFDAQQLGRVRRAHPSIRTGLLTELKDVQAAVELRNGAGADYLAPDCSRLDEAATELLLEMNVPLLPWTVNSAHELTRLLELPNVAGVITDCVPLALQLRGK